MAIRNFRKCEVGRSVVGPQYIHWCHVLLFATLERSARRVKAKLIRATHPCFLIANVLFIYPTANAWHSMGQIVKSLASVWLSSPLYGCNFYSILVKLCTAVSCPKSKLDRRLAKWLSQRSTTRNCIIGEQNVDIVISVVGRCSDTLFGLAMVENPGLAVEISTLSVVVPVIKLLPVLVAISLFPVVRQCRVYLWTFFLWVWRGRKLCLPR